MTHIDFQLTLQFYRDQQNGRVQDYQRKGSEVGNGDVWQKLRCRHLSIARLQTNRCLIMKVCIVSLEWKSSSSGIGYYTRMLVDGLAQRGHSLTLVVPDSEQLNQLPNGCQTWTWHYERTGSHANWLRMAPEIRRQVKRACSKQQFDLVYFTQARDALFCRRTVFAGPMIGGVHDDYFAQTPWWPTYFRGNYVDWPQRWLYYRIVRTLEQLTYRRMDGLIFNSRATATNVTNAFHLPLSDHLICYYGINADNDHLLPRPEKEPVILFVGGNFERKGLPTLLRAFPQILEQHPEYRLVVVGRYTNQVAIQQLATNLGIDNQVLFVGYQDNETVNTWHQRAKLFVMPSLMEGFGIVFLEAMRTGTPVIASDVGGIPEVVRDNENGVLIPPNEPNVLADRCNRLLYETEWYDRLAKGARQTMQRFTPQAMLESTESYFEDTINRYHSST